MLRGILFHFFSMKYLISILISLCLISGASASSYVNPDGSKVSIDRPLFESYIDVILDREIQKFLPQNPVLATQLATDEKGTSEDPATWEYDIRVQKIYENTGSISLLVTSYQYTGGAHGSSARLGIVIDKKTQKRLYIADLYDARKLPFRIGPVWRKAIESRLRTQIGPLSFADRAWILDGTTNISHYQSFVLTSNMLIVYGQEYQHNSFADGMQTLVYPLWKIRDLRK